MRQAVCKMVAWLAMMVVSLAIMEGESHGAEPPKPRADLTVEPLLERWSAAKAAEYLDVRANCPAIENNAIRIITGRFSRSAPRSGTLICAEMPPPKHSC